jgi:tetratricopeptide (TPR) repeat protein
VEETKEEMDCWSHVGESESVLPSSTSNTTERVVAVFQESSEVKASVLKLLNKSRRAQFLHYRYPYAVKCCVRAIAILRQNSYPDDHPLVAKAVKSLQSAHFAESAYNNSANIVKLGIKYEDSGDLVRALKMYTIAYRIRRDSLSGFHPSLVVLLNMLGSIQIKRGELDEAMAIYELALKDTSPPLTPTNGLSDDSNENLVFPTNYLTRAVTYREMGTIYEKRGDAQEALRMYHKSLDCMAEYKGVVFRQTKNEDTSHDNINWEETSLLARFHEDFGSHSEDNADQSGMELTFGQKEKKGVDSMSDYDVFFPAEETKKRRKSDKKNAEATEKKGNCTDVDAALTLHRIAQLHRSNGEHQKALEAFHVSLRGMKFALGKSHPNVAAVLGNIGNLQKEMGDMDAAYSTYQQVLAIESYRLGLSHPDVVVTLHNIATIDASRGNHEHSLSLYTQVINLQRKLFGEDHESVAVTSACMGDVYERLGDIKSAVDAYEEALRIKIVSLGRHSLEVARILHKLGKLAISDDDYHLAHSYISKASLVYKLNKLGDDEAWVVDIRRDTADVDAAIAMGRGVDFFEC